MAADLTQQHRNAQIQLRAQAIRDYIRLWPIWQDDPATFPLLVTATLPLVRTYHRISSSLAASYYEAFRTAAGAAGASTPRLAAPVAVEQLTTSLYVTGQVMNTNALRAGQTPEQARATALARTSGAVTRQILTGGRDTILQSVHADKQALGWARVTDGDPCYFCLTLASRGAVYKTQKSASFEAHDHCACTAMPLYKDTPLPDQINEWRDVYEQAQQTLSPGAHSSTERLNAVRRLLAAA